MKYFKTVGIRLLAFLLIALGGVVVALGQEQLKRIAWTTTSECMKSGFSESELKSQQVACDSFIRDGARIRIVKVDDVVLAVIIGDDGDYLIGDVLVINNSKDRLLVNPTHASMFFWKDGNTTKSPELASPIPAEKIAKKIRKRVFWVNVLGGALAGMQTQTTTVNSTTSGTFSAIGNNGASASGTYTGTTTSTVTTPNTQAQVMEAMRANERSERAGDIADSYVAMSLKGNTLFPNQSTHGLVYFKRMTSKFVIFTLELNGVLFDFAFTNPKQ